MPDRAGGRPWQCPAARRDQNRQDFGLLSSSAFSCKPMPRGVWQAPQWPRPGTAPYLAGRWGIVDEMNVIPGGEERGTVADTLRRLYWDTALSWRPPVLHMLRSVVGMGQVLFGSDYPYLRRDLAVACRHEVETSEELDSAERRAVLAGNALKLFPRLAALAPKEKENSRTQRTKTN